MERAVSTRLALIRELRERLRRLERTAAPRPAEFPNHAAAIQGDLDRLVPSRGLVEWLLEGAGSGGVSTAMLLAQRLRPEGKALVVIDRRGVFHPPALPQWDLEHTFLVHPQSEPDLLWSLEQSLRSPAVGVTLCRVDRLDDRADRRLQLAAEAGGGLGMLVRSAAHQRQPSWADVRLLVRPLPSADRATVPHTRRVRVEVLYRRGGAAGEIVLLELCHATGDVRVVSELARAAHPPQAAGA